MSGVCQKHIGEQSRAEQERSVCVCVSERELLKESPSECCRCYELWSG